MSLATLNAVSKKFEVGSPHTAHGIGRLISFISGRDYKKELWALQDISLEINRGEVVGIAGPNGAGKSTLLSLVSGIYKPDGGSISVHGKVVSIIGLVHGLLDRLSLKENVYLLCSLYGLSRSETKSEYTSIVDFAGLGEYTDTKLYQFSTGMVARIIFSVAVHCRPDILLLDEVTANLDSEFVVIVKKTVARLRSEGVAVIVVSHQKDVLSACDRVLYLNKGRIVQ